MFILVGFVFLLTSATTQAQYNILHSFTGGSDGAMPFGVPNGSLTLSGSTLYGMTWAGGSGGGGGTVFKIKNDGTGYTILYSFDLLGEDPVGSLTLSGSTLYGMTDFGGGVFKINSDGTGYTVLHSFTGGSDGTSPHGSLTLSGSTLYGMTGAGGSGGLGTVFKINNDGTGYTILHSFTGSSDGSGPNGSLMLSGSTLYGMTEAGGNSNGGTVFKINNDGTGYTILHSFTGSSDGKNPHGSLTLSGSTLYGMTEASGSGGGGTVFKINNDGTGYTILHSFAGGGIQTGGGSPGDGANPFGSLTLSGSTLYGMTEAGGTNYDGVVFQINTDGTGFTILHNFAGGHGDGAYPQGDVTLFGSKLYGMASVGMGAGGEGVIFSLGISGGCGYSILPTSASYGSGGGSGSVNVTAGTGCSWTATSNAGWINITAGSSGTGNGTVNYSVSANSGTNSQSGTLTIAGQTFTITQSLPTAPSITTATLPSGMIGSSYSTALAASGGSTPYTWSLTSGGMPAGLSLDPSSGAITGTPTTSGPASFLVRVTGNDGLYSEQTFTLTITGLPPTITTTSTLPAGILGVAYSQNLMATGGTPPYTWSVNPAYLPTGLSLSGSIISGTPSVQGRFYFYLRCTGSDGMHTDNQFSILVNSTTTVATPTISPNGGTFTSNVTVTLTCATDGAVIQYTTNGSDPTSSSSIYSGSFTVSSNVTVKAQAFKSGDSASEIASAAFTINNITAVVATPTITPTGGTFSNSVKVTLSCTTVGATIHYTLDGTDPTSSSPTYKKIAITLTTPGTLKAKSFKGKAASITAVEAFTIIAPPPPTIATTSLPDATAKKPYTATVQVTPGTGVAPYKWSLQPGSKLPAGLSLNATRGVIAGKPTKSTVTPASFTVKVTDAKKQTVTQTLALTVN